MRSVQPSRLVAEFVVIVVGVLVALGVDEWRDSRSYRAAEVRYVDGLISDLERDSVNMATAIQAGATSASALTQAIEGLADSAAVRRSPSIVRPPLAFTYARPALQTTTFDEMEGVGGLGLIRDGDLRFQIGSHYTTVLHHFDRLDQRRTTIAWVIADLFPTVSWGGSTSTNVSREALDSAFYSAPNSTQRLERLLGPEYQGLLNQERIYARSIEDISETILDLTEELLSSLRAYRATLG